MAIKTPIYDISEGEWRAVAIDTEQSGVAYIEISRAGTTITTFEYPAYRVWNIAAHFGDMIADYLERNGQSDV